MHSCSSADWQYKKAALCNVAVNICLCVFKVVKIKSEKNVFVEHSLSINGRAGFWYNYK